MALFSKKLSLDDILKGIDGLSDEEKAKVKEKVEDLDKAEDEREIDKIEEEKADNAEVADEKSEEKNEETEEIGKDVEEVETEVTDGEEAVAETEEQAEETEPAPADETVETEELNEAEEENKDEVIKSLSERLSALEAKYEELGALKTSMEEFTRKQADKFGYTGGLPTNKKEYGEMSAAELAKELRTEI